jgi:hypothetical protein
MLFLEVRKVRAWYRYCTWALEKFGGRWLVQST